MIYLCDAQVNTINKKLAEAGQQYKDGLILLIDYQRLVYQALMEEAEEILKELEEVHNKHQILEADCGC